jgi:hypothetical protein
MEYRTSIPRTLGLTGLAVLMIAPVRRQRFISLWLRNEEQYLSRGSARTRALAAANRTLGFSPFSMAFTGLTPGLDQAYAHLRARVPERVAAIL